MTGAVVSVVFILLAIAVIAGIFLVATGRLRPDLPDAPSDRSLGGLPDVPVGSLAVADVETVRIDQALRGYRMDEVDTLVDRLTAEIAERDAEIARLKDASSGT